MGHKRVEWNLDEVESRCEVEGDCWLWKGALNGGGCPLLSLANKPTLVRKLVFVHLLGKEQKPTRILGAKCLNTLCVSPVCVAALTRSDFGKRVHAKEKLKNNSDVTYIRHRKTIEKQGQTKLNMDLARQIRRDSEVKSRKELAAEHGVCTNTIAGILHGRMWRETATGSSVFNWRG